MKRYVSTWAPVCALIGISLALISCAKQSSSREGYAGSASASEVTSGFPSVVMVILPSGICTGTIIAHNAVLTAAHCLLSAGKYTARNASVNVSTYTKVQLGAGVIDDPNDIGLLIFDDNSFSSDMFASFASSIHEGDDVRAVGYGCNNIMTRTGAGTKRTTTNEVSFLNDYIELVANLSGASAIKNPGTHGIIDGGTCFGDSGGPLFKNGTTDLVGATHAGGLLGNSQVLSQFVDLTRTDNRSWISAQGTAYGFTAQGL